VTLFAQLFGIVFGVGSLAFGYHLAGLMQVARWISLFGAFWLVTVWRRWRWFASIGVVFNLLAAALGLWLLNFSPGWMFAGAMGGLLAFDLTRFSDQMRFITSDRERRGLVQRHLVRIGLLTIIGMTLASLAMFVKKQLTFDWTIWWLVIVAVGLIPFFIWLARPIKNYKE